MKDAYITNLEARGKDASYIADLFQYINRSTFVFAVLLLSLYFLSGKKKHGIRMAILYGVLAGMDILVIPVAEGFFLNLVSLLSVGFRMMLPCIISGAYVFFHHNSGRNGLCHAQAENSGPDYYTMCYSSKIFSYDWGGLSSDS